jgi:hypothetical protein
MTTISLTLAMSFLSLLIILLFSYLLWGCLFNLTSAWLNSIWFTFGFIPLVEFCCPLDGIGILGVLCGFPSLAFSFLQEVLGEDV